MKYLKLTTLTLLVVLVFNCSTEEVTETPEAISPEQTRGGTETDSFTYGDVVIEWPAGMLRPLRNEIRGEHIRSGYLISWEKCSTHVNREIWHIAIGCGPCRPFNDPADDDRIMSNLTCGGL